MKQFTRWDGVIKELECHRSIGGKILVLDRRKSEWLPEDTQNFRWVVRHEPRGHQMSFATPQGAMEAAKIVAGTGKSVFRFFKPNRLNDEDNKN